MIPDLDRKIRVEADASEYVTGGVLSIRCENNKWRSIGFISKLFNKAEKIIRSTIRRC